MQLIQRNPSLWKPQDTELVGKDFTLNMWLSSCTQLR